MTGAASSSAPPESLDPKIQGAAFAIGFSCLITQLVVMREVLGAFSGNELVLGVVLGNWLLAMGMGTFLASWADRLKNPHCVLAIILVCISAIPWAQVVSLRGLRQFVFLRGVSLGVTETVLTSFLVLLPYCLLAGFSLALCCSLLATRVGKSISSEVSHDSSEHRASEAAGQVYAMDSLGSVLGGALFSFVLVLCLEHFAILWVPATLNLFVAVWLAWPATRGHGSTGPLLTAAAIAVSALWLTWIAKANPDKTSTVMQIPGQRLLFLGSSPYGRLVVSEANGQTNFFENGLLLAANPNIEQAEESAHYAMAQRPIANRVLLIGGMLSGIPREILRHDVNEVHCVEIDPLVARVARRFLPDELFQSRIRVFGGDARQFVRTTHEEYDVIIVALPDPATAQLNRFFTQEFYTETRRILEPGGVLCFAVGHYENYASPELGRLLSCARQTALKCFRNLLLIPGGRVYFIASDGPLTEDIASALETKGLSPRLVNRHYLKATLAADRLSDLERSASQSAPLNRDFKPVLYLLQLRYWASQFNSLSKWVTGLVLALGCVYVVRLRSAACAIFTSGFAASALEVTLLLGLQVLAGSVYRQLGLVVTLFMAGLALGAWFATRWLANARPVAKTLPPCAEQGRFSPALSSRGGEGEDRESGRFKRALRKVTREGSALQDQPTARRWEFCPAPILCILALIIATLAFTTPLLLISLSGGTSHGVSPLAAQWIVALFGFGLAVVVGAQFPLANSVEKQNRQASARLYTADFIGASIGALLTSTLLIPSFGIGATCAIAGAMNLLAAPLIFWKGKTA